MQEIVIEANRREIFGKHVKALRRSGRTPAIIYGQGIEPTSIDIDAHQLAVLMGKIGGSTLLDIKVGNETHTVLVRDVQIDVIYRNPIHVDFLKVSMDTAIRTVVSVELVGEAPAVRDLGGVLVTGLSEVEIEALPADLPDTLQIDLEALVEVNDVLSVGDLKPGDRVTILTDPDEVLARVIFQVEEVEEEEEELEDLIDTADEPEVIEKGKSEEEDFE
jgi:large subunit ribosomal protein L25